MNYVRITIKLGKICRKEIYTCLTMILDAAKKAVVLLVLLHSLVQNCLITKYIMNMIEVPRWVLLLWPGETFCEFMFKCNIRQ